MRHKYLFIKLNWIFIVLFLHIMFIVIFYSLFILSAKHKFYIEIHVICSLIQIVYIHWDICPLPTSHFYIHWHLPTSPYGLQYDLLLHSCCWGSPPSKQTLKPFLCDADTFCEKLQISLRNNKDLSWYKSKVEKRWGERW